MSSYILPNGLRITFTAMHLDKAPRCPTCKRVVGFCQHTRER